MSWDIVILNSNKPISLEEGNLPNFDSRKSVINKIKKTFPDSDWGDQSWGILENHQGSIEFNMGDDEAIGDHFMLHVRGGQNPTGAIIEMCKQHGWIAYDASIEGFLDGEQPDKSSFNDWKDYRDQIASPRKPWWKFW